MNFKSLLLILVVTISGCTDFLKGKKSTEHVITIEENEACLKQFPIVFEKFLSSKIASDEIDEALGCLNSTLTRFQTKFRGQEEKDVFSIDDITTIFNFFFKDLRISRDTSEKLIHLKFALIGGSVNTLSKVDVDNLKEFLKALSTELKNISKWVNVFQAKNGSAPESAIKAAYSQLRSSLVNLINSGHISKTQYSVEDFLLLLKQFGINLKAYSEQIEQLLIIKKFLIGDDYVRSKESYISAIEIILDIMQLNAMIENQQYKFDLNNQESQKSLIDLIQAGLQIIKNSPRLKAEGSLDLQILKDILKKNTVKNVTDKSEFSLEGLFINTEGLSGALNGFDLNFENFQTIKTIVFGGSPDRLMNSEIAHFEKHTNRIIGSAYKAVKLLDIKSLDQFVANSPDLQIELGIIFESTFLEEFLIKSDFSKRIFEIVRAVLKSQQKADAPSVNSDELFSQIADPETFNSKQSILKFIKYATELLNLSLQQQDLQPSANVITQIQLATDVIAGLQGLVPLKSNPILNGKILLTNVGINKEKVQAATDAIKILFPQINFEQIGSKDLQKFFDLLQVVGRELQFLTKFPKTTAEFEAVKKALRPVLAATDFYLGNFKTHQVIDQIVQAIPKELGDSNGMAATLKVLVNNREIHSFDELISVLNSVFGAYQLSQKISGGQAKLSNHIIQEFIGMLLHSDSMRIDKRTDINQLMKAFQNVPGMKAAIPQIIESLGYLKMLFPQISDGIVNETLMKKLLTFTVALDQHKTQLSQWPTTAGEIKNFKRALEDILITTEIYLKPMKSHTLLVLLVDVLIQNSSQFKKFVGSSKDTILTAVKLIIADREVNSFAIINSILDSIFEGVDFYRQLSKSDQVFNLGFIQKVMLLLENSDHMRVQKFVRFDLLVALLNKVDHSMLKSLKISEADLLALKVNFFGGSATELTNDDIASLKQLMQLFQAQSDLSLKSSNPQQLIKFFTDSESVNVFYNIFYAGQNEVNGSQPTLAGMSGQLMGLMKSFLKVQSEFANALNSKDFSGFSKISTQLIDQLLVLPIFAKSNIVDLKKLQVMLKSSLNLEITVSESVFDFKRILLGGFGNEISRQDLIVAKKMIQFFEQNQSEFNSCLNILLLDRNRSYTMEQINAAASVVKNKVIEFVQMSQLPRAGLNLESFMKKMEPIKTKLALNIDTGIIKTGHHLLVGPHFDYSLGHFRTLIDTYVDVLRVKRFGQQGFVKLEIKERSQFLLTIRTIDALFSVFENSIVFKKSQQFDTKHFDTVLAILLEKQIIPYQVSPDLLAGFYKKMLNMVFSNPRVATSELPFITKQHFIGLKNEMTLFKFFIRVLDAAFTETNYSYQSALSQAQALQNSSSQNSQGKFEVIFQKVMMEMNAKLKMSLNIQFTKFEQLYQTAFADNPEFFRKALRLYKDEIQQQKGIVFSNGYVVSHNQFDYFSGWADQMRAQYVRTLARLLMQGWGMSDLTEINTQGLVRWYSDFKDFSVATKTFDPRSGNSGQRSMLEANLFSYSGNGDSKLNFSEATQYISLLVTGGGSHFNQAYALAKKHGCLISDQLDVVGLNFVAEPCMIGAYTQNYQSLFSNLNWFVKYLSKLNSNGDRYLFFQSVMEVARNPLNKTSNLESIELKTINMLIMYMESIFSVLDVNQNFTLSPDEIRHGYKRFESLVYSVAEKKSGKLLKAFAEDKTKAICRTKDNPQDNKRYLAREAFIYMIYNGHLPEEKDFFSWSGFSDTIGTAWNCGRHKTIFKFEGEVDRKMMINTFKLLKTVLASEQ